MIRNLLATTAIATIVATGAYAQTTTPTTTQDPAATTTTQAPAAPQQVEMVKKADGFLANNLIGQSVYNGIGDDAENIGDINDLVISPEGDVQAVVIGVGGFLGIGEKDVAIEYDLLSWQERDGQEWLVVETTADALKAQEEFDTAAYEPQPADTDVKETKPATAEDLAKAPVEKADEEMAEAPAEEPMTEEQAAAPTEEPAAEEDKDKMAEAPAAEDKAVEETAEAPVTDDTRTAAIDRESLTERPLGDISAEDFIGTTVYGANDENVGEIGDVVLTEDGKVDAVIVDVGGFLGIGEKEVAVGMDNLKFLSDEDGELYLYTDFTEEQLEAQAEYDESSYAENRDEMRMNVPMAQ
ncbi:MAG: PRC-barrel domain-containing protein [Rhizobiaceae bacterium]|nr:PRC-barrel domain-containing protein [Rhizobiaceae bacterium]